MIVKYLISSFGILLFIGGLVSTWAAIELNFNFGIILGLIIIAFGALVFCLFGRECFSFKKITPTPLLRNCHDIDPGAYRQD